jgi:hypothetical protein
VDIGSCYGYIYIPSGLSALPSPVARRLDIIISSLDQLYYVSQKVGCDMIHSLGLSSQQFWDIYKK